MAIHLHFGVFNDILLKALNVRRESEPRYFLKHPSPLRIKAAGPETLMGPDNKREDFAEGILSTVEKIKESYRWWKQYSLWEEDHKKRVLRSRRVDPETLGEEEAGIEEGEEPGRNYFLWSQFRSEGLLSLP